MRVLFVTTNKHLPELRGGMEVNTHQLGLALLERRHTVGVLCGLAGVGLTGNTARLRSKVTGNPCPMDRSLGYPAWRSYDPVPHVDHIATSFKPDVLVVQGGAEFDRMVTDFVADLRAGGDPDNAYAYALAFWNRHHLRLDGNGGATL